MAIIRQYPLQPRQHPGNFQRVPRAYRAGPPPNLSAAFDAALLATRLCDAAREHGDADMLALAEAKAAEAQAILDDFLGRE